MNEFFKQLGLISTSIRGKEIQKADADFSTSVLVAGEGLEPQPILSHFKPLLTNPLTGAK